MGSPLATPAPYPGPATVETATRSRKQKLCLSQRCAFATALQINSPQWRNQDKLVDQELAILQTSAVIFGESLCLRSTDADSSCTISATSTHGVALEKTNSWLPPPSPAHCQSISPASATFSTESSSMKTMSNPAGLSVQCSSGSLPIPQWPCDVH